MRGYGEDKIGYVYIIKSNDDDLYKIGSTADVEKRWKEIRSMSPRQTKFITSYKVQNPKKLEKLIHMCFNEKHYWYEWYRLDVVMYDLLRCDLFRIDCIVRLYYEMNLYLDNEQFEHIPHYSDQYIDPYILYRHSQIAS